jgi:3-(3-hydroxy-phenyl)propionate hydroxylase
LTDGRRLDDVTGHRFVVAASPEILGDPQFVRHPALQDTSEVTVIHDQEIVRDLLRPYGCEGLVIRPDRYILGTANTPAEFDQLLGLIPAVERFVRPV